MALPKRGTGLITGTARVERGLGIPLSEAARATRHVEQKLYLPLGLAVEDYHIPTFTAKIPWLWPACSGWIGKPVTIPWDETKTTVTSASLVLTRIHSDGDPVDVWVRFNGEQVRYFLWGEGTKCTDQSDVIEVPLLNGLNLLEVYACKQYHWPAVVTVSVSAYVEVTYEGEAPKRPWWEFFWGWLEENWHWVALGLVGVTVGGVILSYTAARALPAKR